MTSLVFGPLDILEFQISRYRGLSSRPTLPPAMCCTALRVTEKAGLFPSTRRFLRSPTDWPFSGVVCSTPESRFNIVFPKFLLKGGRRVMTKNNQGVLLRRSFYTFFTFRKFNKAVVLPGFHSGKMFAPFPKPEREKLNDIGADGNQY
jgi:hypothetical protein